MEILQCDLHSELIRGPSTTTRSAPQLLPSLHRAHLLDGHEKRHRGQSTRTDERGGEREKAIVFHRHGGCATTKATCGFILTVVLFHQKKKTDYDTSDISITLRYGRLDSLCQFCKSFCFMEQMVPSKMHLSMYIFHPFSPKC
jgi:hypothetical protein